MLGHLLSKNESVLSIRSVMRHLVIHTDSCGSLSPGVKLWLLHHDNVSLLVWNFLANNTIFTRLVPLRFFPVSKTKDTPERTEICYDWGDKNCIAGRAQGYTKKRLSEVLWRLEKGLAQVYYIWGGLLWRGQYRYWWKNKYFSRKNTFILTDIVEPAGQFRGDTWSAQWVPKPWLSYTGK